MRALHYEAFGNPIEQVQLVDVPKPVPGPGEILIRLTHRSVNPADLYTIQGTYGRLPDTFPVVPGSEASGEIEALGDGVSGYKVGQRVIPLAGGGKWREYITVPAQLALPVPDSVTSQTAAQLIVNPTSVYVMLLEELALQEGDWLVQTAAGSTLGRIAIQMAKLKGIKTVNVVRRREQVDELLALGADAAYSTEDDDVLEQILAVTGGGATGAIDAVGGETRTLAFNSLKARGTLLCYGLLSGQPMTNLGSIISKETTIRGFWLSAWFQRQSQAHIGEVMTNLLTLMAQGEIVPPVEAEYNLADFAAAFKHMNTSGRSGKILLTG